MIRESTLAVILIFVFIILPVAGFLLRLAFLLLFGLGYGVARAFGWQPQDRRLSDGY